MSSASLEGGSGADTLNFSAGSASILATTIKGGAGADNISLYGANDVVFDIASGDSIFGGTGADTLLFTGSVLNNSIQAGSGSDSIVMAGTGMTGSTIDLGLAPTPSNSWLPPMRTVTVVQPSLRKVTDP